MFEILINLSSQFSYIKYICSDSSVRETKDPDFNTSLDI